MKESRLGIEARHGLPLRHPVVPVELLRLGPPLRLEAIGSAVGGRAPEIENLEALPAGIFQHAAVQEHIRREPIIPLVGSRPGDLQRGAKPI